ncbi:uncharacterized protein QC764_0104550 [Podospora pseudoanserina]|uniref:Heterokaryon incompatibility domain-containing protein n=1 Tax=Podospora pseudoanserina TaxID=2609844 RepID=A0ABR0HLE4_9PEZI|nr:hypothetical protein QC764_0104550 [Podospora pseudoanserina]
MRTQGFVVLGMYSRHLEDYEALLQRQWFTRTWTLQEVLLARSARLVCGRSIKSWDELATVYLRCPEECQSSIGVARRASLGYGALKPFDTLVRCQKRNDSRHYDLEVVTLVRQRDCTEPRDRVYGILGLVSPEIRTQITIDTTLHHCTAFKDFAKAFLKHHGPDLFILVPGRVDAGQESESGFQSDTNLPSWVPDLTLPPLMTRTWSRHEAGRRFSGLTPEHPLFNNDDIAIQVAGIHMATIKQVYPSVDIEALAPQLDADHRMMERLGFQGPSFTSIDPARARQDIRTLIQRTHSHFGYNATHHLGRADFIRTLMGGHLYPEWLGENLDHRQQFSQLLTALGSSSRGTSDNGLANGPANVFLTSMAEAWKGACLVTATVPGCDGVSAGIAPMTSEKGDKVFVFFGGSTPVVTRDSGEGDGSYKVIGPAYVDEFMDGIAFEARKPLENYEMVTIR